MGLDLAYGALISAVTPDSPADQAGLKVGDVIIEFDGQSVADDSQLVTRVSVSKIDARMPIKIFRQGKFYELMVNVRSRREFDWR